MWLPLVRYGIPIALVLVGTVIPFFAHPNVAAEASAMFVGAGLAVLLLNFLYRIGVQGDRDRDREEDARRFFDRHGRWPDESPRRR